MNPPSPLSANASFLTALWCFSGSLLFSVDILHGSPHGPAAAVDTQMAGSLIAPDLRWIRAGKARERNRRGAEKQARKTGRWPEYNSSSIFSVNKSAKYGYLRSDRGNWSTNTIIFRNRWWAISTHHRSPILCSHSWIQFTFHTYTTLV